jgi:AraC-like DNA-binding protein
MDVPAIAQRVFDFIEAHYADKISLADVAKELHYSPSHLTSRIRRETGFPVTAWIIERRLRAARERLLTTDESVTAVAIAVGFRDVSYFVRRFARASGTTPSQWRTRSTVQPEPYWTCPTCGTPRFLKAAC